MEDQFDHVTTDAAREAVYEVVAAGPTARRLPQETVLERLSAAGFSREQGRRALQSLLASGEIELADDTVVAVSSDD